QVPGVLSVVIPALRSSRLPFDAGRVAAGRRAVHEPEVTYGVDRRRDDGNREDPVLDVRVPGGRGPGRRVDRAESAALGSAAVERIERAAEIDGRTGQGERVDVRRRGDDAWIPREQASSRCVKSTGREG